jgi:hypothetical protein
MQTQDIDYRNEAVNLRGYLAFDEKAAGRRPGVLAFHEGLGLGDFVMGRARRQRTADASEQRLSIQIEERGDLKWIPLLLLPS